MVISKCAHCGRDVYWGTAFLGLDRRSVYCVTEGCVAAALGITLPDSRAPDPARQTEGAHMPTELQNEIAEKASKAPRVTPADVEAEIVSEHYFTAADGCYGRNPADVQHHEGPLSLLTFCVLVLRNGFTVTGESACASPENFDADIGRKVARQNAINKVWPLLGFRLRDALARPPASHVERMRAELQELDNRVIKLDAFIRASEVFPTLPEMERERMVAQLEAMKAYSAVLHQRYAAATPA